MENFSESWNKFITLNLNIVHLLVRNPCNEIERADMNKINKNVNIFKVENNYKELLISIFSTL